jgi:hypothetical protein
MIVSNFRGPTVSIRGWLVNNDFGRTFLVISGRFTFDDDIKRRIA